MTKKEFLTTTEPLTLFCFVDAEHETSTYKIVHPDFERQTQDEMLKENPNFLYLYIRNKPARELMDSYGRNGYVG